jgi:TolA-binding protein
LKNTFRNCSGVNSIPLKHKITYISVLLLLTALLSSGCGKHRKTLIARNWHSFLSLFNGYYNANVKFKEGARNTEKGFKFKQEQLIPVFAWDGEADNGSAQLFDDAIKKCDIVIYKHPNGRWIDDCRYLNGKSNFYKQNAATAILNFEYILAAFPKSDRVPETKVWLAKSYYTAGSEDRALNFLDKNLKKTQLPSRLRGEASALEATLLAKKEKYDKAIEVLRDNIQFIHGRKQKARAHYLLAQLYTRSGKFPKAFESYKHTVKMNTDYTLVFNARLEMVRLLANQPSLASRNTEIARLLRELLREEKNKEFLDQIYYEFAMLEVRKNNYEKAQEFLRKSLDHSTTNIRQKSLSYYRAGYIFFHNQENLPQAQLYFDSAASIVTKEAPEYREVKTMADVLREYITHYDNYVLQDSLLTLAAMSPARREQFVDKVIQDEKKRKKDQEEKEKELAQIREMNQLMNQQQSMSGNNTLASSSYNFDDPAKVSSGKMQFQRTWGTRKNEDDWRRSKKPLTGNTDGPDKKKENEEVKPEEINYAAKKEAYLKNIPSTEEEKTKANEKIDESIFGIAQIYHKKLNLPEKAIYWYEMLIKRYPKSDNALKANYALYTIYKDMNSPKANQYKNFIIGKYPDSMYARLVRSQDITEELKRTEQTFDGAYNALYIVYSAQQYETVIDFANYILNTFPEKPKFPSVFYMKGLAFGKIGNIDSMRIMYNYLIQNYPESEATTIARRTLELLDGASPGDAPKTDAKPKDESRFKDFSKSLAPGDEVVVILLAENQKLNINELKIKISVFNGEKFSQDNLNVAGILYKQYYVSMVQKFADFRFAWRYVQAIKAEPKLNIIPKNPAKEIVFISRKNLNTCIQKNNLEDYLDFFEKYHPEMLAGK